MYRFPNALATGETIMIHLTDNAVSAVRRFIDSAEKPIAGLRIKVESGGCSGLQYGMRLEEAAAQQILFRRGDLGLRL